MEGARQIGLGTKADVFGAFYGQLQQTLLGLIEPMQKTLRHFGCANPPDRRRFDREMVDVLHRIYTAPDDEPPLSTFQLEPGEDKRLFLLQQVVLGFGTEKDNARAIGEAVLCMEPDVLSSARSDALRSTNPSVRYLAMQLTGPFRAGVMVNHRLTKLAAEVRKPYAGTSSDPDAGVEQVCDLLEQYPDVADAVYAALGWTKLSGFPPRGHSFGPEGTFSRLVKQHLGEEAFTDTVTTIGLIVAGIAATVLTGGLAAPYVGVLAGAGIGLAGSGVAIANRSAELTTARDASLIGAGSDERVEHAEGELAGAWLGLAITLVSGGAFARLGGSTATSQLVRGVLLGGASGAAMAAVNPNTWASDDSVGVILVGTVLGAGGAALGTAAGIGARRLISGSSAQVAVPMRAGDKPLQPGDRVKVSYSSSEPPIEAEFVRFSGKVMHLKMLTGTLEVNLSRAVRIVAEGTGEPHLFVRSLSALRVQSNRPNRPPVNRAPVTPPKSLETLVYRSTSPLNGASISGRIRLGPISRVAPQAGSFKSYDSMVFQTPDGQSVVGFRGPDGNAHLLYLTKNQSYVLTRADGKAISPEVDEWMTQILRGGIGAPGAQGTIAPGTARARGTIVDAPPDVGAFMARVQRVFQLQGNDFDDDLLLFYRDTGIVVHGTR